MFKKLESEKAQKILTIAGCILCAILIPILIVNTTLLIKSIVNKDEVPTFGGRVPLIVLSDSMYPDIKAGDLIITKVADASEVNIDDVISFYDPASKNSAIVTHKVVDIFEREGKIYFKTKGVNNNIEDRYAVEGDQVIGIYTGTRFGGIGSLAIFMQSTWGLLVCVILPICLFVGYDFLRRRSLDVDKSDEVAKLRAELAALKAGNDKEESSESKENVEE